MKTSKLRTFVGHSTLFGPRLTFRYLDAIFKNRALARDVLKISLIFNIFRCYDNIKIALPRGASSNFDDVLKNRVFARDVFNISLICLLKGEVFGGWFLYSQV